MSWTHELLTGMKSIDLQHQVLFNCLDGLQTALASANRHAAMQRAFDELEAFARVHFSTEEALMQKFNYPLIAPHIAEHEAFGRELEAIKHQSLEIDVCDQLVEFLQRWLAEHIGKTDHQYVPFLQRAGVIV